MSRVNWTDEEDKPGQFALWNANVERSLRGRKGQAALRELEAALVALPAPRLIAKHISHGGEVCTVGALMVAARERRNRERAEVLAELEAEFGPSCMGVRYREDAPDIYCGHRKSDHDGDGCRACREAVARDAAEGVKYPKTTVCPSYTPWDDEDEADTADVATAEGLFPRLVAWRLVVLNDVDYERATPEERYTKVLAWVRQHIVPASREEHRR